MVSLNKLPCKTVVMGVVVADIPPKFGISLSRPWTSKLKGSLQMDMSYATIPVLNENKSCTVKKYHLMLLAVEIIQEFIIFILLIHT